MVPSLEPTDEGRKCEPSGAQVSNGLQPFRSDMTDMIECHHGVPLDTECAKCLEIDICGADAPPELTDKEAFIMALEGVLERTKAISERAIREYQANSIMLNQAKVRIEELEERVDTLEGENSGLETALSEAEEEIAALRSDSVPTKSEE
jgi:hypothetical protein